MEGDETNVFDLLFGLMLPSGNDAGIIIATEIAVALGEHVGKRMIEKADNTPFNLVKDFEGLSYFIRRMNE